MSQIPFNLPAILEGVENRVATETPVFNRYFNTPRLVDSCKVQMDIRNGPNGIMCMLEKDAKSHKVNKDLWETILFNIPRFSEHCTMKPGDDYGRRIFNSPDAKKLGLDRDRQEALEELIERHNLTREFMAIGALCGQITDGCGDKVLDIPVFRGEDPVDFAGNTVDPFEFLFDQKCQLESVLGSVGTLDIWFGKDAYKAFLASDAAQAFKQRFPVEWLNGTLPNSIGETRFNILTRTYLDADGKDQLLLDSNKMIVTSSNLSSLTLYAPIETFENGLQVRQSYIDEWGDRDPVVRYLRFESNFLPFIRRPHGVRVFEVN